jgi:hypothetical protein
VLRRGRRGSLRQPIRQRGRRGCCARSGMGRYQLGLLKERSRCHSSRVRTRSKFARDTFAFESLSWSIAIALRTTRRNCRACNEPSLECQSLMRRWAIASLGPLTFVYERARPRAHEFHARHCDLLDDRRRRPRISPTRPSPVILHILQETGRRLVLIRKLLLLVAVSALPSAQLQGQTIMHLSSNDSVSVLYHGPKYVDGRLERLQVDYIAIDPLSDTIALRAQALAIYALVRKELDDRRLSTLTVRAVHFEETAPNSFVRPFRSYGYVVKKRSDGNGTSIPGRS